MDDQWKDHIDPKGPKQRTLNNYRPITCLSIMWKIFTAKIREYIYYSLTSPDFFPWEAERMPKRIMRHSRVTMVWIDSKTHDMVLQSWIMKWLKMYKIISWSHELYRENHENLENGIDSTRKKLSWSKDPKSCFSTRCTITDTIPNCHDAT